MDATYQIVKVTWVRIEVRNRAKVRIRVRFEFGFGLGFWAGSLRNQMAGMFRRNPRSGWSGFKQPGPGNLTAHPGYAHVQTDAYICRQTRLWNRLFLFSPNRARPKAERGVYRSSHYSGSQTKGHTQRISTIEMGGNVNRTCFVSQEFHPNGDSTVPLCRIDADVPRHNGGTQHTTDDGVWVRVAIEYLWLTKEKNDQDNWPKAYYGNSFCMEYLHLSVFLVLVEGDVVLAVGDSVFLHPVITFGARFWCSPLCVDSRHPGLILKVHLQPLVFIVCSGHPRAHSRISNAAKLQPGVRGPKIKPSFWWRGNLTVRYSSALHTQRLVAALAWTQGE